MLKVLSFLKQPIKDLLVSQFLRNLEGGDPVRSKSRAMVLTGPQRMEMRSFSLPEIGDDDGLLEVELAGVCGSDPKIYNGSTTRGSRPYPIILGHEIVGRICKMGKLAQKRHGVIEGDRVIVECTIRCGTCDFCVGGNYTLCDKTYMYGAMISCNDPPHLFGGYADYLYIHSNAMIHKIDDTISADIGVLIAAVIGNGVRWLRQIGEVSIGDTVAIVGPGQQGIVGVAVAKEAGAVPIIVIGRSGNKAKLKRRLKMAKRFGADKVIDSDEEDPAEIIFEMTKGRMAKVVLEVSGSTSGIDLAILLAGKRGTVVMPGYYKAEKVAVNLNHIVFNEIEIKGVFSHDFKSIRPAIEIAKKNRYPFHELITHRFPLEQAENALQLVAGQKEENPLKVVIDPKM
jgi:alcohol dehydrogenase